MDLKIPVPKMLLKRHTYHLWKPWRRRSWRNSVSKRTGGSKRPTGTDQPNQRRLASPLCWPVFTGTLDIPCSGVEQKVRSNRDCEDTKWRLYGLLTYCCTMKMIKKMICKQYEEVKSDCSSRRCHFVFFIVLWINIRLECLHFHVENHNHRVQSLDFIQKPPGDPRLIAKVYLSRYAFAALSVCLGPCRHSPLSCSSDVLHTYWFEPKLLIS